MKTAIDLFTRTEGSPESITVFTGDAFGALYGNRNKIREATSALIVDALPDLGVDAFAVGEQDLVVDYDQLLSMIATSKVPFLCANLDLAGVKPYTVVNRLGKKILITAALDPELLSKELKKTFHLDDPFIALKRVLETAEYDFSIVVFHFDVHDPSQILGPLPKVDIALLGHTKIFGCKLDSLDPGAHQHTLTASNNTGGQNMAYIDVDLSGETPTLVDSDVLYLDNKVAEDPAMAALVTEREEKFGAAVLAKKEFGRLKSFMNMKAYVGVDWCLPCHRETVNAWEQTAHAGAFSTLEEERRDEDPSCIGCHVVGFMSNEALNGFVKRSITPEFQNVQCEACHGPASEHLLDTKQPYGKVSEATCRSCHTPERDPDFDFTIDIPRGTHALQ